MLFKRIYDEKLAQASYLIGCNGAGEAIVIDPNRNTDEYLRAAASEGVRITRVTETHIHADFISGSRQLASATGATLLLSNEGGEDWQYKFPHEPLKDGSVIQIGKVKIDVLHTPGHTPEHLTFLITDTATGDAPVGAVTGDFVFVGDVGRPDLLEKAAGVAGTMDSSARQLFKSLQKFKSLPDYLQIWPGHGSGSACGKALGSMPQSTLGYEKLFNWAFQVSNENEFVERVLSGQPVVPGHFGAMKKINRDGPPTQKLENLSIEEILEHIKQNPNTYILDVRNKNEWDAGHLQNAHLIPLGELASRMDEIPRDADIVVHCQGGARSVTASGILQANGFEKVANMSDGFRAWQQRNLPVITE